MRTQNHLTKYLSILLMLLIPSMLLLSACSQTTQGVPDTNRILSDLTNSDLYEQALSDVGGVTASFSNLEIIDTLATDSSAEFECSVNATLTMADGFPYFIQVLWGNARYQKHNGGWQYQGFSIDETIYKFTDKAVDVIRDISFYPTNSKDGLKDGLDSLVSAYINNIDADGNIVITCIYGPSYHEKTVTGTLVNQHSVAGDGSSAPYVLQFEFTTSDGKILLNYTPFEASPSDYIHVADYGPFKWTMPIYDDDIYGDGSNISDVTMVYGILGSSATSSSSTVNTSNEHSSSEQVGSGTDNIYEQIIANALQDVLSDAAILEMFPIITSTNDDGHSYVFDGVNGFIETDMQSYAISLSTMVVKSYCIAIVKPVEGQSQAIIEQMNNYIAQQKNAQENYLPEQYAVASAALVREMNTGEIVLVMCENSDSVMASIQTALAEN